MQPKDILDMVRIEGSHVLSSGIERDYYLDFRRVLGHPKARDAVLDALLTHISFWGRSQVNAFVGVATGGIPWAAMLADNCNVPMLYVRTDQKKHGTQQQLEGMWEKGWKVILIDDVSTTGETMRKSAEIVESYGLNVVEQIVVLDVVREAIESGTS